MAFQIKNFVSICAGMINSMRANQTQITDFNVGSVARTLIEAPAIEIEELYQMMFVGLREAIPVSIYNSFNFTALPVEGASGVARFSSLSPVATNVLIPTGTLIRAPSSIYEYATMVDVMLLTGQSTVDVMVYCRSLGSITNALAGTITEIVVPISGINAVINQLAFTTGRDAETDVERKQRFIAYISGLARGTVSAVEYGAKLATVNDGLGNVIEDVQFSKIIEPYLTDSTQPVGYAKLYVHNGGGGTSPLIVASATQVINGYYTADGTPVPGWKAAGIKMDVIAANDVPVTVTAVLTISSLYDPFTTRAAAVLAVQTYIGALDIGVSVSQSEIIATIMKVPGVTKVVLTLPSGDVTALASQKVIPGIITLT